MSKVGKSEIRVDAFDKVTGRTKYYEDRMPAGALYARIKHSTIAHGFVKSVDKSAAENIPGFFQLQWRKVRLWDALSSPPGNEPVKQIYPKPLSRTAVFSQRSSPTISVPTP